LVCLAQFSALSQVKCRAVAPRLDETSRSSCALRWSRVDLDESMIEHGRTPRHQHTYPFHALRQRDGLRSRVPLPRPSPVDRVNLTTEAVPTSVGWSARRERHYQHVPEGWSVHVDRPDRADAVPGPPIVAHEKCSWLAQGSCEDFLPVRIEHRALPAGGVLAGDQQRRDQGDTVLVSPLGSGVASTVSRAHDPERVYVHAPLRRVLDPCGDLAQQRQQGIQDGIGDESVGQGVEITARIGEQLIGVGRLPKRCMWYQTPGSVPGEDKPSVAAHAARAGFGRVLIRPQILPMRGELSPLRMVRLQTLPHDGGRYHACAGRGQGSTSVVDLFDVCDDPRLLRDRPAVSRA
jgi:hypothetical protein